MRCLIVSCVYQPEPVVSAQTSAQLASELVESGHHVTVLTAFPSRPSGRLYSGYHRKFAKWESSALGIKIVRCFSTLSSESLMITRLFENLSFGLTSALQVLSMRKPDVIYSNTWPIVATGMLFLAAKLRRIPLVISVQDLYPEALVAQHRIRADSFLARIMSWFDGIIARHCTHVIVISECFAEIYREQRRVKPNRLSLVPNWIDSEQIHITISGQEYRWRRGIDQDDFLLVYGGNVGVAAGVETIIEAMRLLDDAPGVRLLIAGSGSQLAACHQLAKTLQGQRVLFHSPWATEETSEVLRAADLLLLLTKGEQSLTSVPSKLLSYMLAARPLLVTALPDSDITELVNKAKCGWVIEPGRPGLLSEKIKEISRLNHAERKWRGDNGRSFVLSHLTRDICLPQVVHILENVGL